MSTAAHYTTMTRADDTVEGGKRGCPSQVALQPVLLAADSKLKENGGCVLAISDDAYMLGPPEDIAAVYPDYKANLKKIGRSINEARGSAVRCLVCRMAPHSMVMCCSGRRLRQRT